MQAAWRSYSARKHHFIATLQFNKPVIKTRFVNELGGSLYAQRRVQQRGHLGVNQLQFFPVYISLSLLSVKPLVTQLHISRVDLVCQESASQTLCRHTLAP